MKRHEIEKQIESLNELIERLKKAAGPSDRAHLINLMVSKGLVLADSGRDAEALDALEEAIDLFLENDDDAGLKTRRQVAAAIARRADIVGSQERFGEVIESCGEFDLLFAQDGDTEIREHLAAALFDAAAAWGALGRHDEECAAYEDIYRRFSQGESSLLREQAARALYNKGVALDAEDFDEEAVEAFKELDSVFSREQEPGIRHVLAMAMFNRGSVLREMGDVEASLAAYDEVVRRHGDDLNPCAALALLNKGLALVMSNRPGEAFEAYDELLERFERDPEPVVRACITVALGNKAIWLLQYGDEEDAKKHLEKALREFRRWPDEEEPWSKAGAVMTLAGLDRCGEALAALSRYGEIMSDDPDLLGHLVDSLHEMAELSFPPEDIGEVISAVYGLMGDSWFQE